MIPSPPLDDDGALTVSCQDIVVALRSGILAACCICKRSSIWHWFDGQCYHPLHNTEHCVSRLFEEWYGMLAAGEVRPAAPVRLTGAYARRAHRVPVALSSRDQGSPYFRPGMADGTPWVTVTRLADGRELAVPCADNRQHAQHANRRYRALAHRGEASHPGVATPTAGWIVDPTGQRAEEWSC